jgi:2-methylisocitrate lyase-like PEP mutase family enzyme
VENKGRFGALSCAARGEAVCTSIWKERKTLKKTARLQELLHSGKFFPMMGGGCAGHARIAELNGFECAYMSGGSTAVLIHGIPDAGLVTMNDLAANAERMANCISIPLVADGDQGFGNAINVRRTVQTFIRAGVSGIQIEDQPFPKRCGIVKGKEVIPIEEAVGKYRAAVDAKNEIDPDFVIIARCDARGASGGSLEDVIKRVKAYEYAGVDAFLPEALASREEVKAVCDAVKKPVIAGLGLLKPVPSFDELQALGCASAIYAAQTTVFGLQASWEFACDFKLRGGRAVADWMKKLSDSPMPHIFDLVNFAQVAEWEEKYLPADSMKKYQDSMGPYDPRERGVATAK